MCERTSYKPGELARFWPEVTRTFGRIHFAGVYATQMSWDRKRRWNPQTAPPERSISPEAPRRPALAIEHLPQNNSGSPIMDKQAHA
jgi:hypothetical protein